MSLRRAGSGSAVPLSTSLGRLREAERRQVTVLYCKFELEGDAGWQILDELAQRRARASHPLGVRVAARIVIHTGLAVAGPSPAVPGAISLVGEAPTVVTRLEVSNAAPGTLWITRGTQRLVEGYFQCQPVGAFAVRGLSEPAEVLRVVRPTQAVNRLDVAQQAGLTPLVGRDLEVALLQKHWLEAGEGQGQVVLLSGDAGLGKSRLVHVLKEYVRQSAESGGPQVLEWRCSPYYQNTGLHPLTEFFEALLEFVPAEPPSLRLDKLERYFSKARRRPAAGGHPAAGLAVVESQRTPLPAAGA